eukprot:903300-Pleurochrysis_carterae.AAC.2
MRARPVKSCSADCAPQADGLVEALEGFERISWGEQLSLGGMEFNSRFAGRGVMMTFEEENFGDAVALEGAVVKGVERM